MTRIIIYLYTCIDVLTNGVRLENKVCLIQKKNQKIKSNLINADIYIYFFQHYTSGEGKKI